MNPMSRLAFSALACAALGLGAEATAQPSNPTLNQVHRVYMMSMGAGFDQYLAHQLTSKGMLEVVTDAKLADAVMTESIGADFEARLAALLPPPPAVAKPEPAVTKKGVRSSEMETVISPQVRTSSFGRGRGNLFLVDLKSRSVVWSTFRLPKSRTPADLDKNSDRVTHSLAEAMAKK